ncbi:MAG: flagellar hook-associated protein FlgK [Ignavibacteriaceae bacterium]|jgi:flagellar hook-associated protein 1 FlgK|nr:flagellar hook-associated protein FlgK [Ignavibacteriaceae bacterium]
MGISRIFDISARSLATYQQALDISSHNIANASNPDYSRQKAILSPEKSELVNSLSFGTGVKLDLIQRQRDTLIDSQIRTNNQKYSDNSKRSDILGQVEQLFGEPSDLGLSTTLNSFFNSWSEASVSPNSSPLRFDILRSAENLSNKVRDIYEGITNVKSSLMSDATDIVSNVNNYLKEIQSLNSQIYEVHLKNQQPNDLLDQRDVVIDKLSKLVNINVTTDSSNTVIVSIGGVFAVDKTMAKEFQLTEDNGKLTIKSGVDGSSINLTGGELFAVTDIYSKTIPGYLEKIDSLMNTLTDSVNQLHASGYTITDPKQTGVNFFDGYKDGVLTINSDIMNDPNKIALSKDGTAGNAEIATKIADLSSAKLLNGTTLSDNYGSLISEIGSQKQSSDQMAQSNQLVLQQLDQQKSSVSGVSIDEEMTNVLKFQRAYEASAKMIKIADEMLQTILNMVQ